MKLKELVQNLIATHARYINWGDVECIVGCYSADFTHPVYQIEVPTHILLFYQQTANNIALTAEEFTLFIREMLALDLQIAKLLVLAIHILNGVIFFDNRDQLQMLTNTIDRRLEQSSNLDTHKEAEIKLNAVKGNSILNIYRFNNALYNELSPRNFFYSSRLYGNVDQPSIVLAINALILAGQFPRQHYLGLDFTKPLQLSNPGQILLQRGIEDSSVLWPYKWANKIWPGDGADRHPVYVATDGRRKFFVRKDYEPHSILASKIANLVSEKHFSEEKLFNNNHTGSLKLDYYVLPACPSNDEKHNDALASFKSFVREHKDFVVPGTGIIDEVVNFLNDTDHKNAENLAYSNPDLKKAEMAKIDFDHCNIFHFDDYEKNSLANDYFECPDIVQRAQYIQEQLQTRFMLCCMPRELLAGFVGQAYIAAKKIAEKKEVVDTLAKRKEMAIASKQTFEKKEAVDALVKRQEIAFQKLTTHPESKTWHSKLEEKIPEIAHHLARYIENHFDEPERSIIQLATARQVREKTEQLKAACTPLRIPDTTATMHVVEDRTHLSVPRDNFLTSMQQSADFPLFFEKKILKLSKIDLNYNRVENSEMINFLRRYG